MLGFSAEQGESAAILEPANQRLAFDPGHNHLAIELLNIFFAFGISDRGAIGQDRSHCVADDLDAAIVALSGKPLRRDCENRDPASSPKSCWFSGWVEIRGS